MQINKICDSFLHTLILFDKYIYKQRKDRLLYLDGYLPSFFKGFYYVMLAARCNKDSLPSVTNITDSLFDKSVNSPKSDKRIQQWFNSPKHLTKLRVVAKELIYQIYQWQKIELTNQNRNNYLYVNTKFKEIYELFIRLYFNLESDG